MMAIGIRDLTFDCIVGILPSERTAPQTVVVDLAAEYDYTGDGFLDYSRIAAEVKQRMKAEKFELLEEALVDVSGHLKALFPQINTLTLTISKPDILPDCRVCVTKKSVF